MLIVAQEKDSFPPRMQWGRNWGKGEIKARVGSSLKTLVVPKKSKGKEKFFEPRNESLEHVDFCSSFELGDGDSLLVLPLNNQGRGVGGKQVLEHPEQNKALETQEGEVNQIVVNKMSKKLLALLNTFWTLVVQHKKTTS